MLFRSFVVLSGSEGDSAVDPMHIALMTIRLARRIGVKGPVARTAAQLPYDASHDNTVFDSPLISHAVSARLRFMRGWKQYESCIKGFNGLGLIVEVALQELKKLCALEANSRRDVARSFLQSRRRGGQPVLGADQISKIADSVLDGVAGFDLALWNGFADRTIVCSTSSNMGISLHEALRYFQQSEVAVGDVKVPLLNDDEGSLIIWCPDEEADFMNPEKTAKLRVHEVRFLVDRKSTRLNSSHSRASRMPSSA